MYDIDTIQAHLLSMQDLGYKAFQSALIPSVSPDAIIGVRTPLLRKYAKELYREGKYDQFLSNLPHRYYEENNLHAFLIEQMRDFNKTILALEVFLPYVDNWSTCDSMAPRLLGKYPEILFEKIEMWIKSSHTYTIRFAVGLLMRFFLDERFNTQYADIVASIRSEEYYVNMMVAWYFATALAKQYDSILPYLTEHRLPVWIHNKTIQKAVESYRITDEQKQFLRTLRSKESIQM